VAYIFAAALAMLPVLLNHDLHAFWQDTISYQSGRGSPFSVWGLWGGLGLAQHLVQGAAAGLALAVAFVPRRRGLTEVAALGAAVLIALQLGISHWFYLYIPWFFPLVMLALVLAHPRGDQAQELAPPTLEGEFPRVLAGA
jgi:peptidoglycan/LPS O-acetylase OafA/YrhL